MAKKGTLLDVDGLKVTFHTEVGLLKAVDGVSFDVKRGETLGIVGESGCGKTVTALSILQLLPERRGKISDGKILYYKNSGEVIDITSLEPHSPAMRSIRGNEIAMIFQEPTRSLNPVYTIGEQIMEAVRLHLKLGKTEARDHAIEMLRRVGISSPEKRVDAYPHEFSGGMRQRAMIAMALSCQPNVLIADEPTTALDVTTESQILELMKELQHELGMSIMMITHDLGVIAEMADRIIVMYTGKVVEKASTTDIFDYPKHPYTEGLLNSIPQIGKRKELIPIGGSVPSLNFLPKGCYFAPRCTKATDICKEKEPPMVDVGSDHFVKCWLYSRESSESD